jgi:hypothetical protein
MSCERFRDLAWLAVDEEDEGLGADERRALDEHLAGCAECRARAESAGRVRRGLQQLGASERPAAPPRFKETTLARLEESAPLRRGEPERLAPVLSLWRSRAPLAAAGLLLVALLFWRATRPAPRGPESDVALAPDALPAGGAEEWKDGEHRKYASDGDSKVADFEEEAKEREKSDAPVRFAAPPETPAAPAPETAAVEGRAEEQPPPPAEGERRLEDLDDDKSVVDESRRAQETPLEAELRAAESPRDALARVSTSLEERWRREAPAAPAASRKRGAVGAPKAETGVKKAEFDEAEATKDARKPAEPPPLRFLVLPIEPAALAEWLRPRIERGEAATSERVVVVDLTTKELDELLAAQLRAGRPARPAAAREWLAQAAPRADIERARPAAAAADDDRLAKAPAETGRAGDVAPARRGEPGLAGGKPEHKAETASEKSKEAIAAPSRVRAVLWLGGEAVLRLKDGGR